MMELTIAWQSAAAALVSVTVTIQCLLAAHLL
jgi:hypothetical protein